MNEEKIKKIIKKCGFGIVDIGYSSKVIIVDTKLKYPNFAELEVQLDALSIKEYIGDTYTINMSNSILWEDSDV